MIGVLRSATGVFARCEEDGCEEIACVVVGPRHLCPMHGHQEEQCWKALAHLDVRPMSRLEEIAHAGGVHE